MHILLVSTSSGSRGGGELYLLGLAAGLLEAGYRVSLALSDHPQMDELAAATPDGCEVLRWPFRPTYHRRSRSLGAYVDRRTSGRIADLIRASGASVVHLNKQNVEDGLDLLAAVRRSEMPAVVTVHVARSMADLRAAGGRLRDQLARRSLRQAGWRYITVAEQCGTDLRSFLGARSSRAVRVVHNGVADAPQPDRLEVRASWGISDDTIILGTLARLEEQKNPLFLVREVLPRLSRNVRLVWIGDGRMREQFLRAAMDSGVAERVHLLGWHTEPRPLMAGFDCFVLPSLYEGFPLAILEAMAAGLPVVASDVDGVREAVVDGETGICCRVNGAEQWTDALTQLCASAAERERLGSAAKDAYQRSFSLRAMAEATATIYAEVLKADRPRVESVR